MEKNKYKITVLSDMKGDLKAKLKSIADFSKMIEANITVFHVMKPSSVVNKENQLSAMRSINTEYGLTDKKMKTAIQSVSKSSKVHIDYSLALGNVKEEIGAYIERQRPDIIVIGKKNTSPLKFIGDNITQFVLRQHNGAVLISADGTIFDPKTNLCLATLDDVESSLNLEFSEDLLKHTQVPMKSFKIIKNPAVNKDREVSKRENIIEYVFEHNDNSIEKIPGYLEKNNVSLLFVNKGDAQTNNQISPDINGIINKLSFPVMISNNKITVQ